MIRRFHEAKLSGKTEVECWGTGNARRELIYVEDLADAYVDRNGLDLPLDPEARDIGPDPECIVRPIRSIDLYEENIIHPNVNFFIITKLTKSRTNSNKN